MFSCRFCQSDAFNNFKIDICSIQPSGLCHLSVVNMLLCHFHHTLHAPEPELPVLPSFGLFSKLSLKFIPTGAWRMWFHSALGFLCTYFFECRVSAYAFWKREGKPECVHLKTGTQTCAAFLNAIREPACDCMHLPQRARKLWASESGAPQIPVIKYLPWDFH